MGKEISSITLGKGSETVTVQPRKSRLAKRVIIRFSRNNGFELVIPTRVSLKRAVEFLYKKESWVLEKALEIQEKNSLVLAIGAQIPILGEKYTVKHSGALRGVTKIIGHDLIISGLVEHAPRKITQFLIQLAKNEITARARSEAKKISVKYNKITIRDTSSRWGSCSHAGNLSFSWRLVMAPRAVLEYVVAHELAHLLEMNHSPKFWAVVASIYPHHKQARSWLKAHGGELH